MYDGPWYECQAPNAKYVRESQYSKYKRAFVQASETLEL